MFDMGLGQIQEQKQILSPKMIQSLEVLQMDVQELETYVEQQALENPLIDLEKMEQERMEGSAENGEKDLDLKHKLEWLSRADEQNRVYYTEEYEEAQEKNAWNFAVEENSLQDYVMSQLVLLADTPKEREHLEFLVNCLDSGGYLTEDVKEIAAELKIDLPLAEHYVQQLKSVEPVGVGARNLKECLLLQLNKRKENGLLTQEQLDLLKRLVGEHLALLEKHHFAKISELMGESVETIETYYGIIRSLNPIPGNGFSSRENMKYIKPDVVVAKFNDYFEVLVNDSGIPRLSMNRYYMELLNQNPSEEVRNYILDKYRQLQWLSQCIAERSNTLGRIVKEIVLIQKGFFEHPNGKRVPMGLKDISERLGIHESTVSRAVKNKFLQCAWGSVYPISYFFVRKTAANPAGMGASAEDLKQNIREMIQSEDRKKPLIDQKIADKLEKMNIHISRRTVAKYRMEMELPDASGRKHWNVF